MIEKVFQKLLMDGPVEQAKPLALRLEKDFNFKNCPITIFSSEFIDPQNRAKGPFISYSNRPTNKESILKNEYLDILECKNGQEALALYEKNQFDLIFMEIQMPVMDGHEGTKRIRDIEKKMGAWPLFLLSP